MIQSSQLSASSENSISWSWFPKTITYQRPLEVSGNSRKDRF